VNASIAEQLRRIIEGSRASAVGIAAHQLGSGEEVFIAADRPFHPASTIKICVMMETFRQARLGKLTLNDLLLVENQFRSIVDGSPYSLEVEDDSEKELYSCIGQSMTRGELVRRMITVSSNLATNILIEGLDPHEITDYMRKLGTEGLIVRRGVEDNKAYRLGLNNSATARGLMQVLLRLAKHEVVSPEDSDEMIVILSQQQFNRMIPGLLPAGVRVAHKTGWTADFHHDAGIIYPPAGEPFVLCILTKGYEEAAEAAAHEMIASLAKAVYEYWNPSNMV
jgi:beta-lactamase class A